MGYTSMTPEQVQAVIGRMAVEWRGCTYDLLKRNCTHFSNEFCQRSGFGSAPSCPLSESVGGSLQGAEDRARGLREGSARSQATARRGA